MQITFPSLSNYQEEGKDRIASRRAPGQVESTYLLGLGSWYRLGLGKGPLPHGRRQLGTFSRAVSMLETEENQIVEGG